MGQRYTYEELLLENEQLKKQLEEKKNLEKELEKTQILMQAAFEQSPVPLIVASYPDFTFKIINKATEKFLMVDASNYLNKQPLEVEWSWQEYLPDGAKVTNPAELPLPMALQGIITKNKEMRIERKDGSSVWELVSASPIYDNEGNLIAGILAIVDITERKENEKMLDLHRKQLQEQNEEYEALNEELNQLNIELFLAKEKAEESDSLKTAFLQNMSHEIRTPMNAIMGFTSLLTQNFNDIEKLEHFSKIIELRCNDLLNIINDILDISKIESGQTTLNTGECNVNELISELYSVFSNYQINNQKQHIQLKMHRLFDEKSINIRTDAIKLKQIFINLITNAFKFTETGTIEYGCKLLNDKLLFYVTDTGIGIPKEKYDYIFQRFAQLKNPNSQNIGGTGLGLPIVRGLVELLGGKIWLESEYNKGTTFYFTIDNMNASITTTQVIPSEIPNSDHIFNKNILIVEDDFYNAIYLQEVLKKTGSNIYKVSNGRDAVDFIQKQHIDIVLMDVRLPDITGYEATRLILQKKKDIKIIAQTAYAANDEHKKALDAGCMDYISKPTKKEDLLALLKKHL